MAEKLLDTKQVAEQLDVSIATIRKLVAQGKLKCYLITSRLKFSQADVDRYLASVAV